MIRTFTSVRNRATGLQDEVLRAVTVRGGVSRIRVMVVDAVDIRNRVEMRGEADLTGWLVRNFQGWRANA
ncbi:MAG TPA: hypothetical protein VM120_11445 [Bryobacteraceae bacterium]|nr:hypothetical protein [Bryobacteraceae bacterium]